MTESTESTARAAPPLDGERVRELKARLQDAWRVAGLDGQASLSLDTLRDLLSLLSPLSPDTVTGDYKRGVEEAAKIVDTFITDNRIYDWEECAAKIRAVGLSVDEEPPNVD